MSRIFSLLLALLALCGSIVAQEQDEGARDIFLGSRRQKPSQAPQKHYSPLPPTSAGAKKGSGSSASPAPKRRPQNAQLRKSRPDTSVLPAADEYAPPAAMGLGYTMFLKDAESGTFFRVNPKRIFSTGQAVRLLVESNMEGYLYLFHQENGGPVKLLYPTWEARQGDNRIWAHYTQFVPDPNLYEFALKDGPAIENLTVVVSRSPLPGVPTGVGLRGLKKVPISDELFREITTPEAHREYRGLDAGSAMTEREGARDVEMVKSDPAPAHILLSRRGAGDRIIARLNIEHR